MIENHISVLRADWPFSFPIHFATDQSIIDVAINIRKKRPDDL